MGTPLLIASAVLYGAFVVPLCILWILSLFLIHRRRDPARIGFIWVKILCPLVIVALLLFVVGYADELVEMRTEDNDEDASETLLDVTSRSFTVGTLFENWGNAALLVCQAELGVGFLYAVAQTRSAVQRAARYVAYGLGFVTFTLSTALFAKSQVVWSSYFDYLDGSDLTYLDVNQGLLTISWLLVAVRIIFFATSLLVIALATAVVRKAKASPTLASPGLVFLITAILNFVRYLWHVIYEARWLLGGYKGSDPGVVVVLEPLLDVWVLVALLALLFVLGVRKSSGLWSVSQPSMVSHVAVVPVAQPGEVSCASGEGSLHSHTMHEGRPIQYLWYGAPLQPQPQQSWQPSRQVLQKKIPTAQPQSQHVWG